MSTFRIIPRTAVYTTEHKSVTKHEPLLFLPDMAANPGKIVCYARAGEHSEADIGFYLLNTKKPSALGMELAQWYLKNKCEPEDKAVIRLRWQR